jgi:hypothetical protein
MSRITGEFVALLAQNWHRFTPQGQDLDALATMLAPMDDAGERLADRLDFDTEPSDFLAGLEARSTSHEDSK